MLPHFKSKLFLAPMAGISDVAFRQMCVKEGAGLVFTELTSVKAIINMEKVGKDELFKYLPFTNKERPLGVQLFGHDIESTKQAAIIIEPYFDLIDFNIGCPAQHITAQMAGAALLDKPEHMEKLLSALVSSTNKPVSIKMRAGVNKKNENLFLNIAKIAENVGISMITLHPRTVEQGYSGLSDWSKIKELKEKINVPIVGNGDVKSPEDAKRMFDETNCDYVMIGRAASGNPHIFREANDFLNSGKYEILSPEKKKNSYFEYLNLAQKNSIPFITMKTQAMHFTRGIIGGANLRVRVSRAKDIEELRALFDFENYQKVSLIRAPKD